MDNLISHLDAALHYSRDPVLKKKVALFRRALETQNIAQACREFGISPPLYQYWWRRFRDSGFLREGLVQNSRRPKNSPAQTSKQVAAWILQYRKKFGCSGEKIRRLLEQEKKIQVSLPTVYRILGRGGFRRRKKRGLPPTKSALSKSPSNQAPASRGLPRRIGGRYRILRRLGSGGGGVVYLVEDERSPGTPIALKYSEFAKGSHLGTAALLESEFSALASLRHPNLAQVFDLGMTSSGMYFTSEYIPGRDLLEAVGEADLNFVFSLVVQILAALDFLHRHGILHLDLKPSNILVGDPGRDGERRVKLIDFGGAEWRRRGQTEPGETMGTPPYVAPELLMEKRATPAADFYSLGMILHQVFYGGFPFRSRDPLARMQEQIYEDPLRMENLPPALPEKFGDWLLKLSARDPDARFASASEVLSAFNECLGENYSLRSSLRPAGFLESSEHLFHPSLSDDLFEAFLDPTPKLIVLSGGPGIGKSHLLRRVKDRLQLDRVFPLLCRSVSDLQKALEEKIPKRGPPIFLDLGSEETEAELSERLQRLDEARVSALVVTRRKYAPEYVATKWMEIPDLNRAAVLACFQVEVVGLPAEGLPDSLLDLGTRTPIRLEALFNALEEESALQWGDGAWQWQPGQPVDSAGLLLAQEARWLERREHCVEILSASGLAMNAVTLAGLLSVDATSLEAKLAEWSGAGWMKNRLKQEIPFYYVAEVPREGGSASPVGNWEKLQEELQRLYAVGRFEAGVQWADLLFQEGKGAEGYPPGLALEVARHYVAAGAAERALTVLPKSEAGLENKGLYFEVRARAKFLLGDLLEVPQDLEKARVEYGEDFAGLSRVANLRGSLAKKQLDPIGAAAEFLAALRWAEQSKDDYLAGLAQMNLALLRQERGEFREAYEAYGEALAFSERAAHPWLRGRLLQNWLNFIFYMGRAEEAEKTCYELFRLALKNRYPELQGSALGFLAHLADLKGDPASRLNYLNQAIHLLRARNLQNAYTQALLNRAFFFWEQGRPTPAELDATQALKLAEQGKVPHFLASAQLILGRILRDRPKPNLAEASRYLNRAHQAIHRLGNRQLLWEVEFDRGLVAKKRGEFGEARAFFESARAHLEALMAEVPEFVRNSYLRDRKMELISEQLSELEIG